MKKFFSEKYNYVFNKETGFFMRWGKTLADDPDRAPVPEILDFEITEICAGVGNVPCPFCYKSNTPDKGEYTSLEDAKKVIDAMPFVTQIAFGVDAQCTSNPYTFEIMKYAKDKGIVPNVTVADINDETADSLASICGAVAVSRYAQKDFCYNSIKKLTDRGMKQVNMHIMISKETLSQVYETIKDWQEDERLSKLNAMVLLSLKQKGRGEGFTPLNQTEFNILCNKLKEVKMPFGFDSCSANKYIEFCKQTGNESDIVFCEPCESGLFSSYVNVRGEFFPCSFMEGQVGWKTGIDVKDKDFKEDVWSNERVEAWRETLLNNNRSCPAYNV